MPPFKDRTGDRHGHWIVESRAPNRGTATMWRCRCDCGTVRDVSGSNLASNATASCGCQQYEHRSPTPEQADRMVAAYLTGAGFVAAAATEGFCGAVLRGICKARGVSSRPKGMARGTSRAHEPRVIANRARQSRVVEAVRTGTKVGVVAKQFGLSKTAVHQARNRAGIETDYYKTVNHDFFASIETERQAYWLGFLTADGNVDDAGVIRLRLARRDRDHVHLFRKHIGSTHAVTDGVHRNGFKWERRGEPTEYTQFTCHSPKMAVDLAACGVGPRKSLTAPAWNGSDDLLRHWLRGLVDGDGWVSGGKHLSPGATNAVLTVGLVGSAECVLAFREYGRRITGSDANTRPVGKIHSCQFGGRFAHRLIHDLYTGATVSLSRKFDLAQAVLSRPFIDRRNRGPSAP